MHGRNENYVKLDKLLRTNNYEIVRKKGSHFIYSNGTKTISLPKQLNLCIYRRLLKECGFV